MAGKSDILESSLLDLVFRGVSITGIAINHTSSPLTNLFVSLHSADPGETGTQTTSELAYTGYARVTVARTASGWGLSGSVISPAADITFGACTTHTQTVTATHFMVGSLASGAGVHYYSGTLNPQIAIVTGTTPRITASGTTITED